VVELPLEYTQYLEQRGVFEGFTSGVPGYVALWPVSEIAGNNADVQIETYAPGFIAFGGDGGGELLVFDRAGAVFTLPMIGMEPRYAVKVAESFGEFAGRFKHAT
jgi:hypothetical protein